MTNWGAHDVDFVQWLLNANGPQAVSSVGGRWSLQDNGETPDTQSATFYYDPKLVLQWSMREAAVGRGQGQGLEFFGTKGSLLLSRGGFQVFPDMQVAPDSQIPQNHGTPCGRSPQDARQCDAVDRTDEATARTAHTCSFDS